jgi:Arc/MetJ-type ribon-helix-helix transcriptional regulator
MQLEVSPETQARIEEMVSSGEFPSADAVLEAALDALVFEDRAVPDSDVARLEAKAQHARASGSVRTVDEPLLAELRQLIEAPTSS